MPKSMPLNGWCKCQRCEYEWIARADKPKSCPSCKQYEWEKRVIDITPNRKTQKRATA